MQGNKLTDEALKTTLHEPKPRTPKRGEAVFLRDFVDPVDSESHPGSVNTLVSQWLDSVVGSHREKRCRSDSHLCRSNNGRPDISRTKSAPVMDSTRDADGSVVPPTPASSGPVHAEETQTVHQLRSPTSLAQPLILADRPEGVWSRIRSTVRST
jgi:hypothetical protein